MSFWAMAYNYGWVTKEELRNAVITVENPFGHITKEEYKQITNEEF